MTDMHDRHLSAELIQEFLDGAASPREAARVQDHTAACARCRSEVEGWETLFSELGTLSDVAPSPVFRERVLHTLPREAPARIPLRARLVRWVGASLPGRAAPVPSPALLHPASDDLQDFLEGLLPRREAYGVEGHLHVCRECRRETEAWGSLMGDLGGLSSFAPGPEFSERVMAHVRVQLALVTAKPTFAERMQLLVGSVSPRTRRRVAAMAGAGITPAVTLGLLAYVVFSHPLMTFGNLFSFLWLQGSERVSGLAGGSVQRVTESTTLFRAYQALEPLLASPTAAALAATGLAALTLTAVWVFYRNVLAGQSMDRPYVR